MLNGVFAVYDVQAESYMKPIFTPTKGLAVRSFMDAVNDPNSPFAKYPDDFRLCEIGTFDESTGALVSYEHPEPLGYAREYLQGKES